MLPGNLSSGDHQYERASGLLSLDLVPHWQPEQAVASTRTGSGLVTVPIGTN